MSQQQTIYNDLVSTFGLILTTKELATVLKMNERTIYRQIREGAFSIKTIRTKTSTDKGDSMRFATADVAALLSGEAEAEPARRGRPRKTSAPC